MFNLLATLSTLKAKAILWITGAVVVFLAILKVYLSGKNSGARDLRDTIYNEKAKVQDAFTKIDHSDVSIDSALSSLRKRASKSGYSNEP